jgi:hypothetical protein
MDLKDYTFQQFDKNGLPVRTRLFKTIPRIVFNNSETIVCISLRFNCAQIADCDRCSLSDNEKANFKSVFGRLPSCPATRDVVFQDSFAHLTFSMGTLVDDLVTYAGAQKLDLQIILPNTFSLMTKQLSYTVDQFYITAQSKLAMPFSKIDSIAYLKETMVLPPIEHFNSQLRADFRLPDNDYSALQEIWTSLDISNLYQLFALYLKVNIAV